MENAIPIEIYDPAKVIDICPVCGSKMVDTIYDGYCCLPCAMNEEPPRTVTLTPAQLMIQKRMNEGDKR